MKDSLINLRYNEKKYAESMLEFGFHTKYKLYELKILTKYYKHKGLKPKQRKEKLYEFCEKNIEGFNKVLYFKTINSALNHAKSKKSNLIIIDRIPITKNEITFINNLCLDDNFKKLLFTLLVNDKLGKEVSAQLYGTISEYNSFGGKRTIFKELFEAAKIPKTNKKYEINHMINELSQYGLIEVWNKGKINMNFISAIDHSDDIVFNVSSFDDIGYYYDLYNGLNKVVKCETCDNLFKKKSNNHKLCNTCWRDHRNKYQKELMREKRKLNVSI